MHHSVEKLLLRVRDYVRTQAPDISAFCGPELFDDYQVVATANNQHPIVERLKDCIAETSPATRPIVEALTVAAPYVNWRQSYTGKDGFDAHYLANYSWFNLIAPSGPFVCDKLRVSIGYWEKGLVYPRHWHLPEEIYLVLSGEAKFISEGRKDLIGGAGATVAHISNQPHGAEMTGPLLAIAFWRGDGLEGKSKFADD